MNRKRIGCLAAGLLINAALVFAAVNGVGAATSYLATHDAGVQDRITIRGGVIRFGPYSASNAACMAATIRLAGTCVYVHDNGTHASVGIRSLSWAANRCDVVVNTDAVDQTDEIVAAIADEDETISRLGIQVGVSGGGAKATLFAYRYNGEHVCANASRFGTVSNAWLQLTYLSD